MIKRLSAQYRPLLAIVLFATGLVSCSSRSGDTEKQSLLDIARSRSEADYRSLIDSRHDQTRREVQSLLERWLVASVSENSADDGATVDELRWLCNHYRQETGIRDLAARLDFATQLVPGAAARKLELDSTYRALERAKAAWRLDTTIAALHELYREFDAIGDSFSTASLAFNLANTYYQAGVRDSAVWFGSRAVRICRHLDYYPLLGDCHYLLAKIHSELDGDYLRSEQECIDAVASYDRVGMTSRLPYAQLQRGTNLLQVGRAEHAARLFADARNGFINLDSRYGEAFAEYYIAEALIDMARPDSALMHARRSTALRRSLVERNPTLQSDVAYSINCEGLAFGQLDSVGAALASYRQANLLFDETGDTTGICQNLLRMASVLLESGQYGRADQHLDSVLTMTDRFQETMFALFGKAVCSYRLNQPEVALSYLQACISLSDNSWSRAALSDYQVGWFADKIEYYHLQAIIYLERFLAGGSAVNLDSAHAAIETSRSRALRRRLAGGGNTAPASEEQATLNRLSEKQKQYLREGGRALAAQIESLRDSLNTERIRAAGEAGAGHAGFADLIVPLSSIRAEVIDAEDVVLEYLLSNFGSYLMVTTRDSSRVVPLELDRAEIERQTLSLLTDIRSKPKSSGDLAEVRQSSSRLGQALLPASVQALVSGRRVIIVPAGRLLELPFAVLQTSNGQFLVESSELVYAPSTSILASIRTRPMVSGDGALLVGAPEIPPTRDTGEYGVDAATLAEYYDLTATAGLGLPYAASEIRRIASCFDPGLSRLLVGPEANESAVCDVDFARYRYVHFAVHGLMDRVDPWRSALLLSPEQGTRHDGLLQSEEIMNLSMPVDNVFLSACQTHAGTRHPGEGVQSLARSFLIAGSRSVVATLWNINDRSTARLGAEFYTLLAKGATKSAALAAAQRAMLASDRTLYHHPYFWAPFTLSGSPD
ncbi:CHAT domain-containing protein [candidate division GN15 bacterium]|nr:CHAT domain-containing protein [candidate division GN15 bacterium]